MDAGVEQQIPMVRSFMSRLAFEQVGLAESAKYHLGTGGQFFRAILALRTSRALGLSEAAAVPMAAALELLHNASLIHDDLQDGVRLGEGIPPSG